MIGSLGLVGITRKMILIKWENTFIAKWAKF